MRVTGALGNDNLSEMRTALEELTVDDAEPAILFDLRGVTDTTNLTAAFLRRLPSAVEWRDCHEEINGKRAVLTGSETMYGFARLYQLSSGPEEDAVLKLFRDPRLALEYVGFLGPDPPSPDAE